MKRLFLILSILLITSNCYAVTQLKKTVKPSGGDYTTLEACMNANEQNLVTADKYFDVEIDGTWSSADTTAVTVHNYTTDATRYINIYTTSTARHKGVWSSSYYSLQVTEASCFVGNAAYCRITGLQIYIIGYASWARALAFDWQPTTTDVWIQKNIVRGQNVDTIAGIYMNPDTWNSSGDGRICNNIVYNFNDTYNEGRGIQVRGPYNMIIYNNTVYNATFGISVTHTNPILKNNISYGCDTDFEGTPAASSDYNFSKDDTAPEAAGNSIWGTTDSKTPDFVNVGAGTEDFHLQSTSDAIDMGVDLSATFTDDIDGVTRSGTWDIGADETAGAPQGIKKGLVMRIL